MSSLEIWRTHLWRWLVPLLVVLAGVGVLVTYEIGYAGRVDAVVERMKAVQEQLAKAEARRAELEGRVERVRARDAAVAELYDVRFATQGERFTKFVQEVRTLATTAGLDPRVISYPTQVLAEFGLVERGLVFNVEGDYAGLREFLNLLELSDQFVTLQSITLAQAQGGRLRLQLRLATLFRQNGEQAGPKPADLAPGQP